MRLFELAYCCRLYADLTGFDASLQTLQALGPEIEVANPAHRAALFTWLNAWGCRQFAIQDHETTAGRSLRAWATIWLPRLPDGTVGLTDCSPTDMDELAAAYADLRDRPASIRRRPTGRESVVTFGPTGAVKTLFALRPNVCPPWDDPIRVAFGLGADAGSFARYLADTKHTLVAVAGEARVSVSELPALVGRPTSSPPKLIDEYNWVTITRRCVPPTAAEVARWAGWAHEGTSTP